MTTRYTTFLITTCLAVGASATLHCQAAKEGSAVVGVLTSKTGHTVGTQPAIQRAIEVLIKQQKIKQPENNKRIQPQLDNPIGVHPLRSPNLVIGEPDMVPM